MKNKRRKRIGTTLMNDKLVTAALAAGVREALVRHRKAGEPVAEWKNGKTVWLNPKEIDKQIKKIDENNG